MSYNSRVGLRVALGSDHAGFSLKEFVGGHLFGRGVQVIDLGTDSTLSVDYPDFARKVCEAILDGSADRGVLLCGTGIGMSMMANRFKGIRAALCHDHFTAVAARKHNDANVLVLGGRILGTDLAREIVDTWLDTPFEGDRHERRIRKFDE
ncbi:MAG: ribose 5-phosphate isomerase B [bacterium]|nr:ribose 5-phosphate isomerase B [bacterium]MDT8396204.1 ribose 5-phosphate isomerase B [bacterium]